MRRILLFLFLLAGPSLMADPAPSSALNIVFIGDSITAGVHLPNPAGQAPPAIGCKQIEAKLNGVPVYFSNQGHPGHTTADFLPSSRKDFSQAEDAARKLLQTHPGRLVFSIMLGTNDSAVRGPTSQRLSADQVGKNLTQIVDQLLADFPAAQIFIQQPIWYSSNAHTLYIYGQAGLDRLNGYFPVIQSVIAAEAAAHPGLVHPGDTEGYAYFEKNGSTELVPETGRDGVFYLHPNAVGAASLGNFWAKAILAGLTPVPGK